MNQRTQYKVPEGLNIQLHRFQDRNPPTDYFRLVNYTKAYVMCVCECVCVCEFVSVCVCVCGCFSSGLVTRVVQRFCCCG